MAPFVVITITGVKYKIFDMYHGIPASSNSLIIAT